MRRSVQVATLGETLRYGGRSYPPIAGGAGYALVGSVGARASGDPVTPAFGTGETRAAGNLLICVAAGGVTSSTSITLTTASVTAGWQTAVAQVFVGAVGTGAGIFYKVASGGDAAPTIQMTPTSGATVNASLAEFSGNATSSVLDQHNFASSGAGATSLAVTNPSADAQLGELVVVVNAVNFNKSSAGSSASITWPTFIPAPVSLGSLAGSAQGGFDYASGYGITNANTAADTATGTATPGGGQAVSQQVVAIASFALPTTTPVENPALLHRRGLQGRGHHRGRPRSRGRF